MRIDIRQLRLVGVSRDYHVSFLDPATSQVRPLSIIAGEISTGKSSVLEFIDFCMGASSYPRHLEIERQVRSAQLEVSLEGRIAVIERALAEREKVAFVHDCGLDQLDAPHGKSRRPIDPPSDPNSLSMFLLEQCGLAGITLKQAPTREDSAVDRLSFRDLMWLSFMQNNRLDNKQLLHEVNHHLFRKMRQVIEVVFEVHDDQAAKLAEAIDEARKRRQELEQDVQSLEVFLREHDIESPLELEAALARVDQQESEIAFRLAEVNSTMQARTDFARSLRSQYAAQAQEARRLAARIRDRDTLLQRLLPLRGQYAEDESKLIFYDEARQLFDPLRVETCPSCLQPLPHTPHIVSGECSLCGQAVGLTEGETINVAAELAAVRSRRREIDRYIAEVEDELQQARASYERAASKESEMQQRLDNEVAEALAPFVAERDELHATRSALRSERQEIQRQTSWLASLERRRVDMSRVDDRIVVLRQQLDELEAHRRSRDEVVADLTDRFGDILREFGFPKIDEPVGPFIDAQFVPHVRGNPYRDIGSSGGLTLISLGWILSLFETAIESGYRHPGFLMIDSPQKNLTPPRDGAPSDEFRDQRIAANVWQHVARWTDGVRGAAQVIVVDNEPPAEVGEHVVVRYSGRSDQPPYGLIDNEVPGASR